MRLLQFGDSLRAEQFMDLARAIPQHQLAVGFARHVVPQEAIGGEDDGGAARDRLDHLHRVRGGHAVVRQRLHCRRGIDVGHHHMTGMGGDEASEGIGRSRIRQAAAGREIG